MICFTLFLGDVATPPGVDPGVLHHDCVHVFHLREVKEIMKPLFFQHFAILPVALQILAHRTHPELIFVTNIKNYVCGEKIVIWRDFGKFFEILGDFATIYVLSCGEKLSPKTFVEKK